jgi:hypothetical protein
MNIKEHFKNHKRDYIIVTSSVITTLTLVYIFGPNLKIDKSIRQIGFRNEINHAIISFIERSTPSKPVHLVGTNLYFDSLSDAARKTGHSLSMISRQVNGHIPNVKGDVFEVLTKAS